MNSTTGMVSIGMVFYLLVIAALIYGAYTNNFLVPIGTIVVALIVTSIINGLKQDREREEKKEQERQNLLMSEKNYRDSLEKLKKSPSNSDLKQNTLLLGREYSTLTRDKTGVTIFDEIALMNDINAACAAAGQQTTSAADELIKFKQLLDAGVITPQEFAQKKAKLLG
jgi:hypothetical protein